MPLEFGAQIKDEVTNYAYLLYKLDCLNDLIEKKQKIQQKLVTENIEANYGLPYTYHTIFNASLFKLMNEQSKIQEEIEKSRPKLVTLMMINNCSKYVVDKDIYVDRQYNDKGTKETIKVPDPKVMNILKDIFKNAY